MDTERIYIGKAAKLLGVTPRTLRGWDQSGKLPAHRDGSTHRCYTLEQLAPYLVSIDAIGWLWATRAQAPVVSDDYYCERSDRFTSRVAKLGAILATDPQANTLASLLTLIVGEIGDNSFAHNVGWPDTPGVFFAYNLEKRMIVLADRGQGVLATLRRVRPALTDHRAALKVAFTEIISGREPEKRGNGLKVVRRVTQENPIALFYQSGNARVRLPKDGRVRLRVGSAPTTVPGMFAIITW